MAVMGFRTRYPNTRHLGISAFSAEGVWENGRSSSGTLPPSPTLPLANTAPLKQVAKPSSAGCPSQTWRYPLAPRIKGQREES